MPTEKKGADYIVFHLNKYVVSCEEISQGNNNVYSIGQRFTFFSLRTSRLEARTGRRQPKTATFTRCTSTSTRLSPTSTKSSPTSSLPLSVMQYQCAQKLLISSVFSLYQSFPKQHRIQKEGKIVLSSSRTHSHQTLLTELARLWDSWSRKEKDHTTANELCRLRRLYSCSDVATGRPAAWPWPLNHPHGLWPLPLWRLAPVFLMTSTVCHASFASFHPIGFAHLSYWMHQCHLCWPPETAS